MSDATSLASPPPTPTLDNWPKVAELLTQLRAEQSRFSGQTVDLFSDVERRQEQLDVREAQLSQREANLIEKEQALDQQEQTLADQQRAVDQREQLVTEKLPAVENQQEQFNIALTAASAAGQSPTVQSTEQDKNPRRLASQILMLQQEAARRRGNNGGPCNGDKNN